MKEKEERQRALEPTSLRVLTFAITLATMMLGMSLLPLFPQPLPILISFLVAFVTFEKPRYGMPIGTLLIGFGLMYQLSEINFIAMLAEPQVRAAVIVVSLFLFVALPVIFHRYKDAIAIDMGVIAAILLFFGQTYYLAIPLILTSAVLFKRRSGLTVTYYVLISVPLMMMQYLKFILQITQVDWWVAPGASPPIYVPLTEIFKDIQQSMAQFRLYDTSKVVYAIVNQVTSTPPPLRLTVGTVLDQYLDSFPGIMLFLVIVIGVVLATAFVASLLLKTSAMGMERFLPAFTAASATALFFLFLGALQGPLAFRADINGIQIAISTLAATLLTLPAAFVNYSPKKKATNEMIMEKARELMTKLQSFEALLTEVKSSLPVSVSSTEGKMLILEDKLNDTLSKTRARFYDSSELDEKFNELDPGISNEIDNLMSELSVTVGEYQVYVNCEYLTWIGKLEDIGLEVKTTAKTDFQKELPVETRIGLIKEVLEGGRLLANDVIPVTEQIYEIIRSLCDPSLPKESQSIAFAKQKLEEKTAPWIAVDALFTSLNNWKKQYSAEISRSAEDLKSSLTHIANLSTQSERLLPILGDSFSRLMDHAKMAEGIKVGVEKKPLNIMSVIIIRDALQSSVTIARDVLSILYEELKSKEESIESLLPTKDYLWEKNVTLRKRMASAMEIIFDSPKYELKQVMENLSKSLSCLDECVGTIATYNEREELLLNYPAAKLAIEDLLRQKKRVSAKDLPFEPKYAEEYLRLFHSQRYYDVSFDEANVLLVRKV
jgi:hypothetical protein